MSLKDLARLTQAQGRGNDSMLVHMTPREVGALQTMAQNHGGTLTQNPVTGLPEAGFLEDILPAVAGAGLSLIPGVGPMAAAAITGGATALLSGSLERGLAAGLGAFGGAGLGSGLANAGAQSASAAQLAGAGANAAAAGTATSVPQLAGVSAPGIDLATQPALQGAIANPTMTAPVPQVADTMAGLNTPMSSVNASFPLPERSLGQKVMGNLQDAGRGLQQLFTSPGETLEAMGGIGNVGLNAMMALAPSMYQEYEEEEEELDPNRGYIRPYTFNRERVEGGGMGQRYFDQSFTEHDPVRPEDFRGFAEGGLAQIMRGGQSLPFALLASAAPKPEQIMEFTRTAVDPDDTSGRRWNQTFKLRNMTQADRDAGLVSFKYRSGEDDKKKKINPLLQLMMGRGHDGAGYANPGAMGFLMASHPQGRVVFAPQYGGFQGYAQGGQPRVVDGPGDGMSDDVPAVVDGVQPAALSVDEFVVPADVVSQLGNGSSRAGAKELHAMMDRIRKKAHGKSKQQRKVNPSSVLPA